jgi:hypothetical protein
MTYSGLSQLNGIARRAITLPESILVLSAALALT